MVGSIAVWQAVQHRSCFSRYDDRAPAGAPRLEPLTRRWRRLAVKFRCGSAGSRGGRCGWSTGEPSQRTKHDTTSPVLGKVASCCRGSASMSFGTLHRNSWESGITRLLGRTTRSLRLVLQESWCSRLSGASDHPCSAGGFQAVDQGEPLYRRLLASLREAQACSL